MNELPSPWPSRFVHWPTCRSCWTVGSTIEAHLQIPPNQTGAGLAITHPPVSREREDEPEQGNLGRFPMPLAIPTPSACKLVSLVYLVFLVIWFMSPD
jgi:hypothetical protein